MCSYKLTYNDHGNRNDDRDAAGDRTTDSSQQKKDDLEHGESQAQVLKFELVYNLLKRDESAFFLSKKS
jgi:hypothetical protein